MDRMHDKYLGAVIGAAVGDAIGYQVEFSTVESIKRTYGPDGITGMVSKIPETLRSGEKSGRMVTPFSDDTQMAEVVLRALIARYEDAVQPPPSFWDKILGRKRPEPEIPLWDETMTEIAQGFVEWSRRPIGGHRAPGGACMRGCGALANGAHWSTAGGAKDGGCGSVMRVYPFALLLRNDIREAEYQGVAHSRMTHQDPIALAACAAMTVGMIRALEHANPYRLASEMVAAASRWDATTAKMLIDGVDAAVSKTMTPEEVFKRFLGWAAHDAVVAGLYAFLMHPTNPRKAILLAANTPGDSDSIATITGALAGAYNGLTAIPEEWVEGVERTDDLHEMATQAYFASLR